MGTHCAIFSSTDEGTYHTPFDRRKPERNYIMVTINEYKAMFQRDRAAAREQVALWRDAVEVLDLYQSDDRFDGKTPEHTVKNFVKYVGEDGARFVIASLVNFCAWDGRISPNVAEWAKNTESLDAEAAEAAHLYTKMHMAHLNQVAEAMMRYQPEEETKEEEQTEAALSFEEIEQKAFEMLYNSAEDFGRDYDKIMSGIADYFDMDDATFEKVYDDLKEEFDLYCYTVPTKEEEKMLQEMTNETSTAAAEEITETSQEKTDRENWEHCKSIADELDHVAHGDCYRCPKCGEIITWCNDDFDGGEDTYTCPECGETFDECDLEPFGMWDYFEDCYDIEYRIGSDRQFRSVRLMVACGGPNIYVDTASQCVELYWWTDKASAMLSVDAVNQINAEFEELFNC